MNEQTISNIFLPYRHEFHKACIDPWLLEHRTCPMCKMDILKHYGFVVGAQNQIINLNGFILGVQSPPNESLSTANVQSPTAPPATYQNQNQNHTVTAAEHSMIINANDNDIRSDTALSITRQSDQILAITPTSQTLNICNFNSNTNLIHNDHLDVDGSSSSCSNFNRCNNSSRLSSANNTDNTRLSNSNNCSNLQNCNNVNVCTFSSFIDNTSHPNRNANAKVNNLNDSSSSRRVSDV